MTALTDKIVAHDLEGISEVITSNPELINVPEKGWLPIVWARKTGNSATLIRLLRCIDVPQEDEDYDALLREYVAGLGSDEYEPLAMEETATKLWETLYEGAVFTVGRWKRLLLSGGPGQESDVKFLIDVLGYRSKDSFIRAFKSAYGSVNAAMTIFDEPIIDLTCKRPARTYCLTSRRLRGDG
jgi:AraC-like DNA-binding protein